MVHFNLLTLLHLISRHLFYICNNLSANGRYDLNMKTWAFIYPKCYLISLQKTLIASFKRTPCSHCYCSFWRACWKLESDSSWESESLMEILLESDSVPPSNYLASAGQILNLFYWNGQLVWTPALGAKTIKKNTNSTQNKSQTHRAKQYEVTSFLSTDCELSTETCSKNVYSLGPRTLLILWGREDVRPDVYVTSNVELRNNVRLLLNVELRNYVISRQIVERRVT